MFHRFDEVIPKIMCASVVDVFVSYLCIYYLLLNSQPWFPQTNVSPFFEWNSRICACKLNFLINPVLHILHTNAVKEWKKEKNDYAIIYNTCNQLLLTFGFFDEGVLWNFFSILQFTLMFITYVCLQLIDITKTTFFWCFVCGAVIAEVPKSTVLVSAMLPQAWFCCQIFVTNITLEYFFGLIWFFEDVYTREKL